jgi:iron(III) transport system substrate-binding protein
MLATRLSAYVLAAATLLFALGAEAREVVIYDASDTVSNPLIAAFKKKHPDIEVKNVSGSTGPITERAIAERKNPQADVVYLVNNYALEQLKSAGVFEPYQIKDSKIPAELRDPDGFYTKFLVTTMVMVVNTKRLEEKKLPMPISWEDLIKPVYAKELAMPSPVKSGTGMGILTTFIDAFGWNFVENLNANMLQYSDGGSGGARMAATGEVAIGLTFDTTGIELKKAGNPIEVVHARITPNVGEGGGLVAGAPHPVETKLFLDFMGSEEAAKILHPMVGATAYPGYGAVDLSKLVLWQLKRPVDINELKRLFAERFLKS